MNLPKYNYEFRKGRWSDYTYDECPYCGEHTDVWAPTYRWNNVLMECPYCGKISQSGAVWNVNGLAIPIKEEGQQKDVPSVEFRWLIP